MTKESPTRDQRRRLLIINKLNKRKLTLHQAYSKLGRVSQ